MVALRRTHSPLAASGTYILAGRHGALRALVDPEIARAMPSLERAINSIARILQRCVVEEGLAVSVKFERGPNMDTSLRGPSRLDGPLELPPADGTR